MAQFEKVSFKRFLSDWQGAFADTSEAEVQKIYDAIKLPVRATAGSAGYDICSTLNVTVKVGESVLIPTGIRVRMNESWALFVFPRSGLGFKYRFQLDNCVGVIDSDYYYAENEGHIFVKMTNDGKEGKSVVLSEGDAFAQGIFLPFGITTDDKAAGVRTGGFGSTS